MDGYPYRSLMLHLGRSSSPPGNLRKSLLLQLTSNLCRKPLASPTHLFHICNRLSKFGSHRVMELSRRLLLQVQQNCRKYLLDNREAAEKWGG